MGSTAQQTFLQALSHDLTQLENQGLYKHEHLLASPQASHIVLDNQKEAINLSSNNYLGLANSPEVIEAAQKGLHQFGFGLASVRFICGTSILHHELEERIAAFLGKEAAILYPSCFDANGGLFEALLGPKDAVFSDALNHASIIDGIRLCKAQRFVYQHDDMADLHTQLQDASSSRFRLIATDGVFSMDGTFANLPQICQLADAYDALIMIDDCHATGFIGPNGRGTHDHFNLIDRVDILTGTLGKALGGGSGGYLAGKKEVVEWLRQRSRPYLFSNTIAPPLIAAALKVFDLLKTGDDLRKKLHGNTAYFRTELEALGFDLLPGNHPIVPIMLYEAPLAQEMAKKLLQKGVYVVGFSYPVVPKGQARIRTQMSAAHNRNDLDQALEAFATVGRDLGVLG